MDLVLPEELYGIVKKDVEAKVKAIQYFRVIMPLSELLEGDFFNSYIKSGSYRFMPLFFFLTVAIYLPSICHLFNFVEKLSFYLFLSASQVMS